MATTSVHVKQLIVYTGLSFLLKLKIFLNATMDLYKIWCQIHQGMCMFNYAISVQVCSCQYKMSMAIIFMGHGV